MWTPDMVSKRQHENDHCTILKEADMIKAKLSTKFNFCRAPTNRANLNTLSAKKSRTKVTKFLPSG